MAYRYFTCDVFTEHRFGGNPLAVLPEASGLTDEQMQRIAREFNFSESTFVFPPEAGHTRKVRIFTPTLEVPFAGHPNIGTAFVLAATGALGELAETTRVAFEEKAGVVPISIQREAEKPIVCELVAPKRLSLGASLPIETVARAVSLPPEAVITRTHPPVVASVGLPFIIAELADRSALERARADVAEFQSIAESGIPADIHLYTRSSDEFDLRSRMFAPLDGVNEDPATGSANCTLVGMLAHFDPAADGDFPLRIAQGVEMGRPSVLLARAEKRDGVVVETRVGGACVMVSEGWIEADAT